MKALSVSRASSLAPLLAGDRPPRAEESCLARAAFLSAEAICMASVAAVCIVGAAAERSRWEGVRRSVRGREDMGDKAFGVTYRREAAMLADH